MLFSIFVMFLMFVSSAFKISFTKFDIIFDVSFVVLFLYWDNTISRARSAPWRVGAPAMYISRAARRRARSNFDGSGKIMLGARKPAKFNGSVPEMWIR